MLIILAGVSISLVLGNNGIISKAKQAKVDTEEAKIKEEIQFILQENFIDSFVGNITSTKEQIIDKLVEKLEGIIIKENQDEKITGEYKGYEFEIDEKYNVTILGKANIRVTYILDPQEYAKEAVTIKLSIEALNGKNIVSVTPENLNVEVIEEKVEYKVTENGMYKFKITDSDNNVNTRYFSLHLPKVYS